MANEPKGKVVIDSEECKGCGLCVESCPTHLLELDPELNHYGVHPAVYKSESCNGCGICYYCCPEPGAITVYKQKPPAKGAVAVVKEVSNAATV